MPRSQKCLLAAGVAFGTKHGEHWKRSPTACVTKAMNTCDRQGEGLVEGIAGAIRVIVDELGRTSPIAASAICGVADNVHGVFQGVRNKNTDRLLADARDMAKRKPALAFTAAAALEFSAFRVYEPRVKRAAPPRWHRTPQSSIPSRPFDELGDRENQGSSQPTPQKFKLARAELAAKVRCFHCHGAD